MYATYAKTRKIGIGVDVLAAILAAGTTRQKPKQSKHGTRDTSGLAEAQQMKMHGVSHVANAENLFLEANCI